MGALAAWSTLTGEVLERGLGLREESVFDVNIALADGKQKEKRCLGVLSGCGRFTAMLTFVCIFTASLMTICECGGPMTIADVIYLKTWKPTRRTCIKEQSEAIHTKKHVA